VNFSSPPGVLHITPIPISFYPTNSISWRFQIMKLLFM